MTTPLGTPFEVSTQPAELSGAPGDAVQVVVEVSNNSDTSETFSLRWLGVDSPTRQIGPIPAHESRSVDCVLEIPFDRRPAERGIAVEVVAADQRSVLVELRLVTGTSERLSVVVRPRAVHARRHGRFELEVTNRGSVGANVDVDGGEPGVRVQLQPARMTIAPGATTLWKGHVRARGFFFGDARRKVVPLWVSSGGTPVYETLTFQQRAIIPVGARKAVALLGVLAVWAAMLTAIVTVTKGSDDTTGVAANDGDPGALLARTEDDKAGAGGAPAGGGGKSAAGAAKGAKTSAEAPKGIEISGLIKLPSSGPEGVAITLRPVDLDGSAPGRPNAKPVAAKVRSAPLALQASAPSEVAAAGEAAGKSWSETTTSPNGPLTDVRGTVSNADGEWGFASIPAPGLYELVFAKAGFDTRSYLVTADSDKPIHFDVELQPGRGAIRGQVSGPAGALGAVDVTVTDGTVVYRTSTAGGAPGESQPNGGWSMDGLGTPARYTVTFTRRGYGTETLAADLAAGATLDSLSVTMTPGVGSVSGMVKSGGEPLGGATISVSDGPTERSTTTLTDSSVGSYLLPQLPLNKTYTVTVSKPGYLAQTLTVELADNAPGIDVDLRRSTAMVYGTVTDASNGNGIGGVGIRLTNGAAVFKSTTTVSPPGTFELSGLPPGTYVVEFTRFEYEPSSSLVTVVGGDRTALSLALNPRPEVVLAQDAQITGTITDSRTGQGLKDAKVKVLGHPQRFDGTPAEALTSSDGRYTISKLGLGTWVVEISGPTNPKFQSLTRTLRLGPTTAEILDATLLPLGSLTGKVTDTKGGPIGSASVSIESLTGVLPVDSNGIYKSGTDLKSGTYRVTFSAPGFQDLLREISVVVGATTTLDVSLYQWPQVLGRVLQPQGDPVTFVALPGTVVTLHRNDVTGSNDVVVDTNPVGEFAIPTTQTPPGSWDITASQKPTSNGSPPAQVFAPITTTRQLTLEQGQSIDLVLSPQIPVRGRVSWVDVNNTTHEVANPRVSASTVITGYIPSLTSVGQNPTTASRETLGDANGNWSILGQVGGTSEYRASAVHLSDSAPRMVKVVPPSAPSPTNFVLEPLLRSLSGRVLPNPGGTPDGFQVTVKAPGVDRTLADLTDVNGNFQATALRPGTYDLTFKKPGFKDATIKATVPLGFDLNLGNVQLDQLASLQVTIRSGLDQSLINGADVELRAPGASVLSASATTVDGLVSFTNLLPDPAAPYTLTVKASHHRDRTETTLVAAFGQAAAATVTLDRLGRIEGTAVINTVGVPPESFANADVNIKGTGPSQTVRTDPRGQFVLDDLAPGLYKISIEKVGYQQTKPANDAVVELNTITRPEAEVQRLGALVGVVKTDVRSVPGSGTMLKVTAKDSNDVPFETTTDDLGRYRIPNLLSGRYTLSVSAPRFATTTATATVELNKDTATDLVLQGLGDLVVRVVDRDGVLVTGATVSAKLDVTVTRLDASTPTGTFRASALPTGTYTIRVSGPGYASPAISPTAAVALNADTTIDVPVDRLGSLTGILKRNTLQTITPLSAIVISAKRGTDAAITATTNNDGRYTFTAMEPGDYVLTIGDVDGFVQQPATTTVAVGFNTETTQDLTVVRLGLLRVKVTRSVTGSALGGVLIEAKEGTTAAETVAPSTTVGTYTLAGLPAGTLTLSLTKAGYAPITGRDVTIALNEDTVVDVSLDELAALVGTIELDTLGVRSNGAANIVVTATPIPPAPGDPITATTTGTGAYRIANLQPGTYRLTATVPGYVPVAGSVTAVAAYSTETTTNVVFQRLGALKGKVEAMTLNVSASLAGVTVTATADDTAMTRYTINTDTLGNYRINGLPASNYSIVVERAGYNQTAPVAAASVALNADTTANVSLTAKAGSVSGTVESDSNSLPLDGVKVTATFSVGSDRTIEVCTTPCAGGLIGSGAFNITGLQPTSIELTFSAPGHKDLSRTVAALAPGQTLNIGKVTLLSNRSAIAGVVKWRPAGFGTDEGPVAGSFVTLTEIVTVGTPVTIAPQTTTAMGLGGFSFVGLTRGKYRIGVSHPDYQAFTSIDIDVDGVNTRNQDLVLTPKVRTLNVEVFSSRGNPLTGATVSLSGGSLTGPTTAPSTNSSGVTQFTLVAPGPQLATADNQYKLSASSTLHQSVTGQSIVVETSRDTTVRITLSATAVVTIPVTFSPADPNAKANVNLKLIGSTDPGTTKTCGTTCSFNNIPAGNYRITYLAATPNDYVVPESQDITVSATEDITALSVSYNKLASVRVTISSPGTVVTQVNVLPTPPRQTTDVVARNATVLLNPGVSYVFSVPQVLDKNQAFSVTNTFTAGQSTTQAIAVLGQGSLNITVKNSANVAVTGAAATVTAVASPAVVGATPIALAWESANNAYVAHGVAAGTYDVTVSGVADHAGGTASAMVVTTGAVTKNVNLSLLQVAVTGTLTSNGQPVANATVKVGTLTTTTGTDGSYSFTGVTVGSYSIATLAKGSCAATTKTEIVSATNKTFDLAVDTSVDVVVLLDSDGSATDADLTFTGTPTTSTPTATATATGSYTVSGVAGWAGVVVTATKGTLTASSTAQNITPCQAVSTITLRVK